MSTTADLFGMKKNTYLMLMHLSFFLGYAFPLLGWVAPIILWQTQKTDPDVDRHGKNIVNFLISYLIYGIIATILVMSILLSLVGGLLLIGIVVAEAIFVVIAALKANNDEYWTYPMTIEFIK